MCVGKITDWRATRWLVASLLPHYTPTIKEHVKTRLSEARQRLPKVRLDWQPLWPDEEDPRSRFNASKVALRK